MEAATAVQLGVQLGGKNTYQGVVSYRAIMGEKLVPLTKEHIATSVIHMRIATLLFTLVMLTVEVLILQLPNHGANPQNVYHQLGLNMPEEVYDFSENVNSAGPPVLLRRVGGHFIRLFNVIQIRTVSRFFKGGSFS